MQPVIISSSTVVSSGIRLFDCDSVYLTNCATYNNLPLKNCSYGNQTCDFGFYTNCWIERFRVGKAGQALQADQRPTEKKCDAGCLFQPADPLSRPHNPQPAHVKCGTERVGPHNPHILKKSLCTPIIFSCNLIFSKILKLSFSNSTI